MKRILTFASFAVLLPLGVTQNLNAAAPANEQPTASPPKAVAKPAAPNDPHALAAAVKAEIDAASQKFHTESQARKKELDERKAVLDAHGKKLDAIDTAVTAAIKELDDLDG